jgi:hypothetical protein
MIKLQNILAENMRRFGTKNLAESNIQEAPAEPIQPYLEINPKSWKFKDAASQDALSKPPSYAVSNVDPKLAVKNAYGMWCLNVIPSSGGQYQVKNDSVITLQMAAVDLAMAMAINGVYNPLIYKDFQKAQIAVNTAASKLQQVGLSNGSMPGFVLGNDKGLTDRNSNPNKNMSQKQWESTLQLLVPGINAFIAKYVIAPVAAQSKTATPGSPAPVTKN